MKNNLLKACLFCFGLVLSLNAQSILISEFDFNGNLNDNLSNSTCISYNNSVTSYSAGSFNWTSDSNNLGGGLKVSIPDGVFTENHYSIAINFKFSETSSYRKIIDFFGRTSDAGLYVNTNLRLYSFGGYGPTVINPDSNITILMTRDSTDDSTRVYLWDGVLLSQESFGLDGSMNMVSNLYTTNRVLHFFADDSVTLSEFSLSGSVEMIKIWNGIATLSDLLSNEEEVGAKSKWKIFPNPAMNETNISFDEPQTGVVQIFSLHGQLIKSVFIEQQFKISIDLNEVPTGMYIVRFKNTSMRMFKQ